LALVHYYSLIEVVFPSSVGSQRTRQQREGFAIGGVGRRKVRRRPCKKCPAQCSAWVNQGWYSDLSIPWLPFNPYSSN